MTEIEYTWEIISVNDDGMIVEYTNPEHGTLQVGTRLPYEGETIEDRIEAASPARWWHDLTRQKLDVAVGTTGSGSSAIGPAEPEPEPIDLTAYTAHKRWEIETGGIEVSGQIIDTSRESQAMITGAYAYSQANPDETIQFKAANGWVMLDAPTMAAIATAVGAHVQACFALEASVASQIANGAITTTGEIDAAFG